MEVTDRKRFISADDVGVLDADPSDVLASLDTDGSRKWMYPLPSKGRYYWRRLILGWALIALFVSLPIVRIGGKPAVFLDVMSREFTFFGATFYPTDTFLLMIMMIGTLLSVILFTALLGRVWCGWACPQTVYLEFVFRPIEAWLEGKPHVRRRRDEGPWTLDKAWRKGVKWSLYLVISMGLAHTFVAYFAGWHNLLTWMQGSPTEHWGYFVMMAGTTGLIMFDFGIFREQMCTIACPYARFQSVLLDPDSLLVAYDEERGEPRGKGKDRTGKGDCIDCHACVATCPTGIDIRDGLQMECIACTQCIDACDDIMDKMGFEPGLIRYTSENELAGKTTRWLRPRTALYSVLLVALLGVFTTAFLTRGSFDVNVARAVGQPFMVLPDGDVANRLRFRVRNQTPKDATFTIGVDSPEGAEVKVAGPSPVAVDAEAMTRIEAWVVVAPETVADGREDAVVRLTFSDGTTTTHVFPLLGPTDDATPSNGAKY
jgi:cytochrome c oxidase accessory protein FixG